MKSHALRALVAFLVVALLTVGAYVGWLNFNKSEPRRRADQGEPQKSAEAILQERANQAGAALQSPLGQLFVKKNWKEFKDQYQPKSQFLQLAELIRASYIHQHLGTFTPEDTEELLKIVYDTFERLDAKDYAQAGLLVTQFQRLPFAPKRSAVHQQLESWLSLDPVKQPLLVRLAVSKIATQDLRPSEKAIQLFISTFQNPIGTLSKKDWIRLADDIRSPAIRQRCLKSLLQLYPQLSPQEQAQALIVMGREPTVEPKRVIQLALTSLQSSQAETFEAGLRAVAGLLSANLLNSQQKEQVLAVLPRIASNLKTPFVEAKIEQILPKLRP